MEDLREDLKATIIDVLNLEDIGTDEIDNDTSLFGDGLGLDSIDALELIVMLERNYGVKIENPEEGKEIFKSINTIAAYIEAKR